jgi:hypothetical protein
MTNKTKVDDDLAEVLDADFDSYVLNPWTWVDPDGGTPHYVFILPRLCASRSIYFSSNIPSKHKDQMELYGRVQNRICK